MNDFDEEVLHRTMSRVMAWERLNDPQYSSQLTMGKFYDLMIESGYTEEEAQQAANRRGWDRLEAGIRM